MRIFCTSSTFPQTTLENNGKLFFFNRKIYGNEKGVRNRFTLTVICVFLNKKARKNNPIEEKKISKKCS